MRKSSGMTAIKATNLAHRKNLRPACTFKEACSLIHKKITCKSSQEECQGSSTIIVFKQTFLRLQNTWRYVLTGVPKGLLNFSFRLLETR